MESDKFQTAIAAVGAVAGWGILLSPVLFDIACTTGRTKSDCGDVFLSDAWLIGVLAAALIVSATVTFFIARLDGSVVGAALVLMLLFVLPGLYIWKTMLDTIYIRES